MSLICVFAWCLAGLGWEVGVFGAVSEWFGVVTWWFGVVWGVSTDPCMDPKL